MRSIPSVFCSWKSFINVAIGAILSGCKTNQTETVTALAAAINIPSKKCGLLLLENTNLCVPRERREAELCEAYRSAATPEEAATVLQRYALRFTISDATLDFLKLPRSTANPDPAVNQAQHEHETVCEDSEPQSTQQKTCDDLHNRLEK